MEMQAGMEMQSEAKGRAERLSFVRGLSGLSRDQLTHRYGIAKSTLQNWESGRTCLTQNGAMKLLSVYRAEQIEISLDWLLHGVGTSPKLNDNRSGAQIESRLPESLLPQRKQIIAELKGLRKLYPDLVECPINDTSMQPIFPEGSYVAGIKYYQDAMQKLIGHDCLVYALAVGLIVRRLMPGDRSGHYHLVPTNLKPEHTVISNCKPVFVAKIIWAQAPVFRLS